MNLNIALVTGGLPFTGDTLEKGSLGGSETAFIQMAKALHRLGHRVHAFCNCPQPMLSDGVHFHEASEFKQHISQINYDVVISSRWPEFLHLPGNAGLRVFWGHDTLVERSRFMSAFILSDLCILLSDFHIANYREQIPEIDKFVWKSRNGIDYDLIRSNLCRKVPNKVIYTSRPERGLHYLLGDIFPLMLQQNPDLQLCFANYDLQGMQIPQNVQQAIDVSYTLARNYPNNVRMLGSLSKAQLYQEISSSQLLLYPTDFPEISCITAIEAQACGTPIITTNDFALKETVVDQETGFLIDGKPTDPEYVREFSELASATLCHPETIAKMGAHGTNRVLNVAKYTWDAIAKEWEEKFTAMLDARWKASPRKVIQRLVLNEDLVMAKILARQANLPDMVSTLADTISDTLQSNPTPVNTAEVKDLFSSRMPVYNANIDLLNVLSVKPKTVLDWHCGFAPFGIVLKKHLPDTEVTFVDSNPQALANVSQILEKIEATNYHVAHEPGDTLYDMVYLGHHLERSLDPQALIEKVSKFVKPDGILSFMVSVGPKAQVYSQRPKPTRVWNFHYTDFVDIFASDPDFKSLFVQSSPPQEFDICGTHLVLTRPVKKCGKISVERRRLTTRPYQTISACMISHNEEANIAGALYSIAKVVDNIIVADNSSPGNPTPKIAQDLGAEVHRIEFDNFSQARNESIRHTDSDWILWMDADERLTDPIQLRKYIVGTVFEGYSIKQVHLTVDELDKTHDIPTRLFRNREHYKFTGLVHEQVEDLSKGPFDQPITPTLLIPDCCLAHFGYIYEGKRRVKASSRNLSLLIREAKECPGRMLTKVLILRDCLNLVKWRSDVVKKLSPGSFEHKVCEAAVSLFLRYFRESESKYTELAEPMYQEALRVLGISGVGYGGRAAPPFEVMSGCAQSYGGFSDEQKANLRPKSFWVIDEHDFLEHTFSDTRRLLAKMDCQEAFDKLLNFPHNIPKPTLSDDQILEVLSAGVGLFK